MKKSFPHWQIAGFVFTSILGTFLHVLFDLTGGSAVAAVFSAVNESIFEHMKLIYYPMLLFALVEYRIFRTEIENFWCIKLAGILLALVLIPSVYYLYTGALGISADWFNITIFFIAAAVSYRLEVALYRRQSGCFLLQRLAFGLILLIGGVFTALTFYPPHIPLFEDPVTGTYGFQAPM